MLAQRHIPNALTISRLVMTAVFIAMLAMHDGTQERAWLLLSATGLFVVAALTDTIDGCLARRWRVESLFGRVMDPVADKLLVLGGFVMLAAPDHGVQAWMVVVILSRELLVTSLRSVLEVQGVDFRARWSGKAKMVLQSLCVPVVLVIAYIQQTELGTNPIAAEVPGVAGEQAVPFYNSDLDWLRDGIVWLTVTVTVLSGVPYVAAAARALRGESASARFAPEQADR